MANAMVGLLFCFAAMLDGSLVAASLIGGATLTISLARYVRRKNYLGREHSIKTDLIEYRWIVRHCVLAGLAWGLTFGLLLVADPAHLLFIMLALPGMMFTGSLSIDCVYRAAVSYIVLLCLGSIAGLLWIGTPEAHVSVAITVYYGILFTWRANLSSSGFAARVHSQIESKEATETVHLLLNDYEEHSADWLWEIDDRRAIVKPSSRFRSVAKAKGEHLSGMDFLDLFDAGHDRAVLERLIDKAQSFREVNVKLTLDGEERWWALSGHPALDASGKMSGMRGVASDVSAAKRAEAKISHLARYDGLTNLPNRMLFLETLTRALSRRKEGAEIAVLYLDLDHFKAINDTLGHAVGDQVLKVAAERIENCLGLHDTVARQGGDEFAVLLPEITNDGHADLVASAIIAIMAEPIIIDDQQVNTGASIGIAFAPQDATQALDLIKSADLALYHSKQNGRGRASHFEFGMHEAMQAKRKVEIDLRSAIVRDELELFYQPLINLDTGETSGYEALLRWNHPVDGMIMPAVFIPVAEDTGLIVPLGEWVIRNALAEVARWPQHLSVSVNLSPSQMRSPNLVPTVIHALAASGVPAHRLEMEITETVLMHDSEANLAVLHQLRSLGVRIALDDFGTGYSSLNYLRSFPFDKIKIDRCFVNDVDSRDDSRAIIRAVTGLAQSLGMVTTAEGVEREDQLDHLRGEGCTEVQGYYFAKPLPASNVVGRVVEDGYEEPAPVARPSAGKRKKAA